MSPKWNLGFMIPKQLRKCIPCVLSQAQSLEFLLLQRDSSYSSPRPYSHPKRHDTQHGAGQRGCTPSPVALPAASKASGLLFRQGSGLPLLLQSRPCSVFSRSGHQHLSLSPFSHTCCAGLTLPCALPEAPPTWPGALPVPAARSDPP